MGYIGHFPGMVSHHFILAAAAAKSLQLCPTLCDPIDGSPPGYSVPGILQATILEWAAISFSDFILEVGTYCLEEDVPLTILLLLDSALSHPPIHGQLSSQCQSNASATQYYVTYPTYRPVSDFQEILFMSHFLSGNKGE